MPSLLLVVFLLQLVIHLINNSSISFINEVAWLFYNKLPTPTSTTAQKAAKQKRNVLRLKKELAGISAQDDFARWAKIRREHDKVVSEYEKTASSLNSSRSQFDTFLNTARWLGLKALPIILQFWNATQPIFWLPTGWLPYYAEWLLSFPRAPLGSVSIQIWGAACLSAITMSSEVILALYALSSRPEKMASNEQVPMASNAPSKKTS